MSEISVDFTSWCKGSEIWELWPLLTLESESLSSALTEGLILSRPFCEGVSGDFLLMILVTISSDNEDLFLIGFFIHIDKINDDDAP